MRPIIVSPYRISNITGVRLEKPVQQHSVMAGLVPAIHVLFQFAKAWMPGTRPGMTQKAA
jgi:hypothetical protein